MEKFCPTCSRVYAVDVERCEVDGERLVILREEPSLVGHELDGKYTMLSKLGEGGMGSVYRARQSSMDREVAIKVLRREFSQNRLAIKRFLREAKAASKLGHPNTITVYDFGQSDDGLLYLVMELLTGRPLADLLDDEGPLPVERAVHIMAQVCDSLSEAHHHKITHRDLKPENIFIEQKVGNPDFVKVLDFGIAKMQGDDSDVSQATATGMICGTPSYMSPEQAMGQHIDGRSDIYALGVLLYEMVTDHKPFEGDTPMEVMLKHINEPAPNIFECTQISVPEGIQDTISAMLAKKAPGRPLDCQQVKARLLEGLTTPLVSDIGVTGELARSLGRREDSADHAASLEKTGLSPVVPSSAFGVDPLKPGRRRWLFAALLLLLVSGVGLVAWLSARPDGADRATPTEFGQEAAPASPDRVVAEAATADAPRPGSREHASAARGSAAEIDHQEALAPGSVTGATLHRAGDRAVALSAASAKPALPEQIRLRLETQPPGAKVYEGAQYLGETPLELERAKGSPTVVLTVKKPRFQPRIVEIGTADNIVQQIALVRTRRSGSGASASASGKKPSADDSGGGDEKKSGFGTF